MTPYTLTISDLRLGEFDLGGVLYHARYYHLYEQAREACLREHGCPYHELVADSSHLAVVESGQKFRSPIFYGEPVEVRLSFAEIGATTVRAEYELSVVRGGSAQLVHDGFTKLVFVHNNGGRFKAGRFPEKLLRILRTFTRDSRE